jgi:hypothetical protein
MCADKSRISHMISLSILFLQLVHDVIVDPEQLFEVLPAERPEMAVDGGL